MTKKTKNTKQKRNKQKHNQIKKRGVKVKLLCYHLVQKSHIPLWLIPTDHGAHDGQARVVSEHSAFSDILAVAKQAMVKSEQSGCLRACWMANCFK